MDSAGDSALASLDPPRSVLRCAVTAQKGGVGKTTTVLGLAGAAWDRGMRTLVVDLDPQANSTAALDPLPFHFTTSDVLADGRRGVAEDAIVGSGWGPELELIPSERGLEHRNVAVGTESSARLRTALTGVADAYDVVLVDCPPSLGELTRNALTAVDVALVVTEPSFFALAGAAQALEAIEVIGTQTGLRAAGILVNRMRERTSEHQFRLDELHAAYGDLVLDTVVPERACLQQAQGACVPVQAWRSPAAAQVSEVYDDVLATLFARAGIALQRQR